MTFCCDPSGFVAAASWGCVPCSLMKAAVAHSRSHGAFTLTGQYFARILTQLRLAHTKPTCAQQAETIAIVQEGHIADDKGHSPPQTSGIACRRAEHAIDSARSPITGNGHPHSSLQ